MFFVLFAIDARVLLLIQNVISFEYHCFIHALRALRSIRSPVPALNFTLLCLFVHFFHSFLFRPKDHDWSEFDALATKSNNHNNNPPPQEAQARSRPWRTKTGRARRHHGQPGKLVLRRERHGREAQPGACCVFCVFLNKRRSFEGSGYGAVLQLNSRILRHCCGRVTMGYA